MTHYSIDFTDNEYVAAREFKKEHKDCCKNILGKESFSTTGGAFTYIITPTGLGNNIIIKCNSCGEIKDITDVDGW